MMLISESRALSGMLISFGDYSENTRSYVYNTTVKKTFSISCICKCVIDRLLIEFSIYIVFSPGRYCGNFITH